MQIYDLLKKDHVKVKALMKDLVSLKEKDEPRRHKLISDIRDALIPHSRAEESVLYNSLRTIDSSKSMAMHGYVEHLEAEALLRTLQVAGKIDAGWRETALRLQKALDHHVAEEEGPLFSAAKQLFTDQEAEMMGEVFTEMKPEIKEEGIVGTTIDMLANLMPPRLSSAFKSSSQSAH
jgi:hemerythrin superfamily protein